MIRAAARRVWRWVTLPFWIALAPFAIVWFAVALGDDDDGERWL